MKAQVSDSCMRRAEPFIDHMLAEIASRYTLKQHLLYEARTSRTVVSTHILTSD